MHRIVPLLLLAAACALPARAQMPGTIPRDARRPELPPATRAGRFEGTWFREEPRHRIALQVRRRDTDGAWQVRLFWDTRDGFSVDTNWEEVHEFRYRGFPGLIELRVDQQRSTPDRLVVHFRRQQDGARKSRLLQEGDAVLRRGGRAGRSLVWTIEDFHQRITVGEPIGPYEEDTRDEHLFQWWIFRKESERLIPWDEIHW